MFSTNYKDRGQGQHGRSIPAEWLFELPPGYRWERTTALVTPQDSWYYVVNDANGAKVRWMTWDALTDQNVMLMGKMYIPGKSKDEAEDGGDYDFAARTPEEMRAYVLTLLAAAKLLGAE